MATAEQQYDELVGILRTAHAELLVMERDGKINASRDNPALVGDYLIKLRLHANMLFAFQNRYLDTLNEALRGTALKRQDMYETQLALGKSENAAKNHADEMTRVDNANIKVIENKIQQLKNEYERYNGICISLQSRMREFDTERRSTNG